MRSFYIDQSPYTRRKQLNGMQTCYEEKLRVKMQVYLFEDKVL